MMSPKAEPITLMAAEPMMSVGAMIGAKPMPDRSMVKMPALCSIRRSTTATGGSAADSHKAVAIDADLDAPGAPVRSQRARPCA